MKNLIIILALVANIGSTFAQNNNWKSTHPNQHMVYLNVGYDFGMTTHIGYSYQLDAFRPITIMADYSFPMGNNLIDDFKFRAGGQISLVEKNNFIASAKVNFNLKRHQTSLVRMTGIGSEFSVLAGYHKLKWHIAAEFGLDESVLTHLKQSDTMKEISPEITDGWVSNSGGHFFYGIQGSKTIGKHLELSLRIGATKARSGPNALLPYYAQIGLNWKLVKEKAIEK